MNKIEIEIPNDKEIDWEASAKQKKIVFKNKQVSYKDVCDRLFIKGHYCTDNNGNIHFLNSINPCPNNASTQHQLECILAKNKLANVARYLNGKWDNCLNKRKYIIWMDSIHRQLYVAQASLSAECSNIIFKSKELAKQAIKILGEETVKLALEPLY